MARLDGTGDIISLDDPKAGALSMSVPLLDYRVTGDPAKLWATQPAIRTVVGAIARNVGGIPLKVYRRKSDTDRERVTGTDLSNMLGLQPAPWFPAARYFEQLVLDLAVHDRWACLVGVGEKSGNLELTRLPAHKIAVAVVGGRRDHLVYFTGKGEVQIPLDRVLFDVAPSAGSPENGLDRGASRIVTLASLTDELDEAAAWRRQVLKNGARVPAYVTRPAEAPAWSDAAFNRFKASMESYRQGGGLEGGVPILEDGMALKPADVFKPSEFDTAGLRSLTLLEAAVLFHYPPELLGAREGNYSNIEALRESLYVDHLGPWVTNLEQALNVGLIGAGLLEAGQYVEADLQSKLRGAFEDRARIMTTASGRPWLTTNEVRARENLPSIGPDGDELVTPLNVTVGGLASPNDTRPDSADDPKAQGRLGRKSGRPDGLGTRTLEADRFAAALEAYWQAQAGRIADHLNLEAKALEDVAGALDIEAEQRTLEPVVRRYMQRLAEVGAWDVLATWNPESDGWDAAMVEGWIAAAAATNARQWQLALQSELVARATDRDKLAAYLAGAGLVVALGRKWTAEAHGFGGHDAAAKSGLGVKTWRVHSTNPRPSHGALNGQSVALGDVFGNGLRWPGDNYGTADDNAGCTCTLTYGR